MTSGKRNTWLELERKDNRGEGSKRSEMKRERIIPDYTKKKMKKIVKQFIVILAIGKRKTKKKYIYI